MRIPVVIYFLIATALLVFGPLRAYYFGWKHRVPAEEETPEERKRRRRHVMWGVLWFLFGAYIAYLGWQMRGQEATLQGMEETAPEIPSGPARVKIVGEPSGG